MGSGSEAEISVVGVQLRIVGVLTYWPNMMPKASSRSRSNHLPWQEFKGALVGVKGASLEFCILEVSEGKIQAVSANF